MDGDAWRVSLGRNGKTYPENRLYWRIRKNSQLIKSITTSNQSSIRIFSSISLQRTLCPQISMNLDMSDEYFIIMRLPQYDYIN